MRALYSQRFQRSYDDAPPAIQPAIDRRIELLLGNLRHPSLRAKKYDEARDIWQARVTLGWRLYFQVEGDAYYFIDVMPHPK